ncbi:MAG: hypothetical protein ACYDC7_12435 [Acidithiobacillus ferrivorans]|nr:hypothetical protein [Acidithiobacillus ferridurans]MBU2766272.1 hypothetical protein [Acidithiobacillus ferrivorans]MBU2804614.1 hypothetical protein [Acidithiobacillus ferridurans]MBU2824934.1 hypothetical protein [Acidithiobacillus ferrooxidans]
MPRKPIHEQPMTAAQRKKAQYQRDKRATIDAIGAEEDAPDRALLALMRGAGKSAHQDHAAQRAWEAFGQRYGWIV